MPTHRRWGGTLATCGRQIHIQCSLPVSSIAENKISFNVLRVADVLTFDLLVARSVTTYFFVGTIAADVTHNNI
jgi:hypothetical protein